MIFQRTKEMASSISFWDKLLINAAVLGDLDDLETALTFGARVTTRKDGWTPLHRAAKNGHLNICEYIMDKIENINPGDNKGWTPYHSAASEGHLNVCKHIMDKIENKNPGSNDGWTPYHSAALQGHLDICKYIIEKVEDKNPFERSLRTL